MERNPTAPAASAAAALPAACAYRRLWLPDLVVVLGLMLITVLVFSLTPLDIDLQRLFYREGNPANAWPLPLSAPWNWLYHYGFWPAILVALGAFGVLVAGCFRATLARYRIHCYFLVLVLALGPGLVVNLLLKEHWGRPRPREICEFGGRWQYQMTLAKGQSGRGKSFPCGHSAIGYYLCTFYFVFRRRRKALGRLLLALGAVYGTAMGIGRMLDGAHFASDVLWSAYVLFLIAWGLYYFVLRVPAREDAPPAPLRRQLGLIAVNAGLLAGIAVGALVATPVYVEVSERQALPGSLHPPCAVEITCGDCNLDLSLAEDRRPLAIDGTIRGFGWTTSRVDPHLTADFGAPEPVVRFDLTPRGIFSELVSELNVVVGQAGLRRMAVTVHSGNLKVLRWPTNGPPLSIRLESGSLSLPASLRGAAVEIQAPPGAVTYAPGP